MNTNSRRLHPIALLLGLVCIFSSYLAYAAQGDDKQPAAEPTSDQQTSTQQNMEQLLEQIRVGRIEENQHHKARQEKFVAERDHQAQLLAALEQQLVKANQQSQRLESEFHDNESSLLLQQQRLQEELGEFGELLGVVRQVAADTSAQLKQSMVSAQLPGRSAILATMAKNKDLPTTADIEKLWFTLTQEMREQGRVLTFETTVLDTAGLETRRPVTRIGPFVSYTAEGQFLRYLSATGQLNELPRQPRATYQNSAQNLTATSRSNSPETKQSEQYVSAPVDPSSGAILSLLVQRPSLVERIQQGGIIGYIVIFIGAIGILFGLERTISLSLLSARISKQISAPEAPGNNPLGRIFHAFGEHRISSITDSNEIEQLELKLDDLILQETPALKKGLSTLKVLAGIAPLLGLLGTVTGMVETFDVITLFGSGDAKLMAGGISQALITTALGLTAAIPTLLLHSLASSRCRTIVETLEEQTAGLLAQFSQRLNADNANA